MPKLRAARKETKIACLSERWDSLLMWSHYSNSHHGYCIEYEVQPYSANLKFGQFPLRIKYSRERSVIRELDFLKMFGDVDFTSPELFNFTDHIVSALYLEKSDDWSYEREWRVSNKDSLDAGYCKFPLLKPCRIILGANSDSSLEQKIRNEVPANFPITRVGLDHRIYGLILEDK